MGKWFADDDDLSTCAFGVQNRHATWGIPSRRGENAALPGRDGTLYAPDKPFDEHVFQLQMFAAGADEDGSIPADETRATYVRKNLDRIARIFGTGRLLRLAYVEDDASPYGRRNVIANPSFEAASGTVVTRENVIPNPSGEYSSGLAPTRRNYIGNPSMELASADFAYRTNMVVNPRMESEGRSTAYRSNLVINPSFEVDTSNWRASGTGATIARIAKIVTGLWPLSGRWSARLTSGAAGDCFIGGGNATVKGGTAYTGSYYALNTTNGSRTYKIALRWYDRTGTYISMDTSGGFSVGSNAVGRPYLTATAPANARQVAVRAIVTASGSNENHYIDQVMVEAGSTLNKYFDGETDEVDGYRHRWVGVAGVSASEEYGVEPLGWHSEQRLLTTTQNAVFGEKAAKTVLTSAPAGTLLFAQTVREGCNAGNRSSVSGLIYVQASTSRAVAVRLACYSAGGTYLGPVTSGGNPVADVVGTIDDSFAVIETPAGALQAGTDRVCIEVRTSGSWSIADYAYFDGAMVEPVASVGAYFDGDTPDIEDFDYQWSGDDNYSESEMIGAGLDHWVISGGNFYQSGPGYIGQWCLRVETDGSTDRIRASTTPLGVRLGFVHTFSVYVKTNRTQNVTPQAIIDGVTTSGTPVACTAGAWTRVVQSILVPSSARSVSFNAFGAVPSAGDMIDFDAALLEATSQTRAFFDGNSGVNYAWEGDAGDSTSVYQQPRADSWNGWGDAAAPTVYRTAARALEGSYSVMAVANYAGDFGVTSGRDNVDHDQTYTFAASVSIDINRTVRFGLRWADATGAFISESVTNIAVNQGAGFTRGVITADPPPGAAVVSPYVAVIGGQADEVLYVDSAVFGFGGTSTYADGDTASWEWTGTPDNSASQITGPRVVGWVPNINVTLARSGLWKSERSYSGLIVVSDVDAPQYIASYPDGAGVEKYYEYDSERAITFGADVRAREAGQFQLKVVPYTWDGWQFSASADPIATSPKTPIGAGSSARLVVSTRFTEVTTHYELQVHVYGNAGGAASLNQGAYVDRAIAGPGSWDGAYFDGSYEGASWDGTEDESGSQYYGEARVVDCEVRDAVDFSSKGYGGSANFVVTLRAPSVFFRDQLDRTVTIALGRTGMIYSLYELSGGTAQIRDSLIRLWGPIDPVTITDIGSGAWISINRTLRANQFVEIDNSDWTVKLGQQGGVADTSLISVVKHGGSATLLPITPVAGGRPQIRVDGNPGDGAILEVVGRRGYHLA